MARSLHGFSLIELMIGLSIAVILIILAAPNYAVWTADAQIRSGTESIADGMRLAHAEAIKRNAQVDFILDRTTATGGWRVVVVGGPQVQQARWTEAATRAQFAVTPAGATTVRFDGMGGIVPAAAPIPPPVPVLREVDITHFGTVVGTRPLKILVGGTRSGIKICDPDPAIPASSPRFCTV